jgi:hypothetical protein
VRCRELPWFLEEWLEGQEIPDLSRHLESCARCRGVTQEVRQWSRLLRGARQEPSELSAGFWVRLRENLGAVDQRQQALWAAFAWLAQRTAVVFAVLLLLLGVLSRRPLPVTSITGAELTAEVGAFSGAELTRDQILLSLLEPEAEP